MAKEPGVKPDEAGCGRNAMEKAEGGKGYRPGRKTNSTVAVSGIRLPPESERG